MQCQTDCFFRLPAQVLKLGKTLYDKQMWAWGQDIRHPDGNALKRFGFQYQAGQPYKRRRSSSAYTFYWKALNDQFKLQLWSFGLTLGNDQAEILLKRFDFRPKWIHSPLDEVYWPKDLPSLKSPRTLDHRRQALELLSALCWQLVEYEHWIEETYGVDWRQKVFKGSKKNILPNGMAQGWQTVGMDIDNALKGVPV